MSLPTRNIGGTPVSVIGFGAMGLSTGYGEVASDKERLQMLDAVYAGGCTFWDTADVYGDSEDLIGQWFEKTGKRADVFLATKFGFSTMGELEEPGRIINGSPEYMKRQFNASLQRLKTDYIDLYYLHRPDQTVPIEVTVRAMVELVKAGKVRHLGLSECSARTLRRAHAVHPIAAVQVEYSAFALDIEDPKIGLLAAARELGIAVVAYSPLGRGMLTGQYKSPADFAPDDFRARMPRFSAQNFPRLLELSSALSAVGTRYGATAGQVALAWLLAQGPDVVPIPGTKKTKYLEENLGAARVQLSEQDVREVREAALEADKTIDGLRYPPGYVELSFADTPEE